MASNGEETNLELNDYKKKLNDFSVKSLQKTRITL